MGDGPGSSLVVIIALESVNSSEPISGWLVGVVQRVMVLQRKE